MAQIAGYLSPHFKGGFWTGKEPPGTIGALPFSAVIDMENGLVIARDTSSDYVMIDEILTLIKQVDAD